MRYYTREDAEKATRERIKELRTYAGLIPTIKKVFQDFNGKVYNCRVDKAIQAATGEYIKGDKRSETIDFYTYNHGNCFTLARMSIKDMTDGKRINAAQVCESLNENRARLLEEAANLERQLDTIGETLKQFEQLKKVWEKIAGGLEWAIIDNYGIKRYL